MKHLHLLFISIILFGCAKEPIQGPNTHVRFVKINFTLTDGTKEIAVNGQFSNNINFKVETFKLYFSNIYLNENLISDVFLFNLESNEKSLSISLEENLITSLSFGIGLTDEQNSSDPVSFASDHPLSISQNTYWYMTPASYIYLMSEFKYDQNGDLNFTNPLTYHLAHSDLYRNFLAETNIDLSQNDTTNIEVILNLPLMFENINVSESVPHSSTSSPIANLLMDNIKDAISIE